MLTTEPGSSTSVDSCTQVLFHEWTENALSQMHTLEILHNIWCKALSNMVFFGGMLLLSRPNLLCADLVLMLARNFVKAKMPIINSVHCFHSNNNLFHVIRLIVKVQSW